MKKYGNTNSEGLCTVKNPYNQGSESWADFEYNNPPLPLYTPSGQLLKDAENVEVEGPFWQWKNYANLWLKCDDNLDVLNAQKGGKETRQIYRLLTVLPTESEDYTQYEYYEQPTGKWWPCHMDIDAFKKQGIEIRLIEPVPMSSKVIKSADIEREADEWCENNGYFDYGSDYSPAYYGFLAGVKWIEKENPQFATEAGGSIRNCLEAFVNSCYTGCSKKELEVLRQNAESALTAPSNNSSSEMVDKYRQALSQIRRVEMLTPETEAMINKLLNQ